jgi:hypothetical protein
LEEEEEEEEEEEVPGARDTSIVERPISTAMAGTHALTSCCEKVKVLKALPALPIAMNSKALLRAEDARAEVCREEARVLGMPEAHSVCAAELVLVERDG